ncbi:MAG: pyruvate formate lyase family protein, partial [Anaerolineae bacterium]|nr:pyruvate formate lyase family protein [Anaerolineae bacterium]
MHPFHFELIFTKTYQKFQNEPIAIREAECMRVLYPALMQPIQPGDCFAGRLTYKLVGFGLELASGGPGYYCHSDTIRQQMDEMNLDAEERRPVNAVLDFWAGEATIRGKLYAMLPAELRADTENPIANMEGRLAGACLDFGKLVRLGLPGLCAELTRYEDKAAREKRDTSLYQGMRLSLQLLGDVIRVYAQQAVELSQNEVDPTHKAELLTIARTLENLTRRAPATFREATQLVWLYALVSGVVNYGRMDVYLGSLFCQDIQKGLMDEAEGLRLLQSLWRLIAARKIVFNSRVVLGGQGRPNEADADRFALVAMEATRTVIEIEPQLTLRHYTGMNPALMQKALDVVGEGRTFPMLYNDDVNIPAVAHAFNVSLPEAEHYYPYGCGEYVLEGLSFGSPNCSLNLLKCLEMAMRSGTDALTHQPLGVSTGHLRDFASFEDFFAAYRTQVEHYVARLADRHAIEYQAEAASASFFYI